MHLPRQRGRSLRNLPHGNRTQHHSPHNRLDDSDDSESCHTVRAQLRQQNQDLGFCAPGEGGRFIEEGRSDLGGEIVVNTSGGLLSKGHIIGATGISQIGELVKQLRGSAGDRQVEGARVGLQHNSGGYVHTEFCSCAINILTV